MTGDYMFRVWNEDGCVCDPNGPMGGFCCDPTKSEPIPHFMATNKSF